MKILLCHNYYQQPGGEDQVFADEGWLLESRGHTVLRYTVHNEALHDLSGIRAAGKTIFNREIYTELDELIGCELPDVVHCHNTFPLMSPAVHAAARRHDAAVVQTLHNYRVLCPKAVLMRDGRVCEECLGKRVAWPAVWHGCYRDNRAATIAVTGLNAWQRLRGAWHTQVDRYIALTEFAREKFIAGGLPAEQIAVKPNFVHPDPGAGPGGGNFAVFVGRLSAEKGIECLLDAWTRHEPGLQLKVIGDGPLASRVREAEEQNASIEWLGRLPFAEVCELIGRAEVLVMPSVWYETFGRTITEAFAKGTPVVASRLGAMQELVDHQRTGLLFTPGDAAELAAAVRRLVDDGALRAAMRSEARREYDEYYTAEQNYSRLIEIYEQALAMRPGKSSHGNAEPQFQEMEAS